MASLGKPGEILNVNAVNFDLVAAQMASLSCLGAMLLRCECPQIFTLQKSRKQVVCVARAEHAAAESPIRRITQMCCYRQNLLKVMEFGSSNNDPFSEDKSIVNDVNVSLCVPRKG